METPGVSPTAYGTEGLNLLFIPLCDTVSNPTYAPISSSFLFFMSTNFFLMRIVDTFIVTVISQQCFGLLQQSFYVEHQFQFLVKVLFNYFSLPVTGLCPLYYLNLLSSLLQFYIAGRDYP
jgi:hypothetical protein